MTREKWEAMSREERKAWRERKDLIITIVLSAVTTILMHITLHWLGWIQ